MTNRIDTAGGVGAQDVIFNELNSLPLVQKLTTTGKVQGNWPSVLHFLSTAARNADMPSPTADGVAGKLWWVFSAGTGTITVRTNTGGTIIALTSVRRGALIASLGGVWRLLLKSAT